MEPSAQRFGSAIHLLYQRKPLSEIANAFGISRDLVRKAVQREIGHRRRDAVTFQTQDITPFDVSVPASLFSRHHVPVPEDILELCDRQAGRVARLEDIIEDTFTGYASRFEFVGGIQAMSRLQPLVGKVDSIRRIGARARIYEHRAWFEVHLGYATLAAQDAQAAVELYRIAYLSGTRERLFARRIGETGLIWSLATLHFGSPHRALKVLQMADDACLTAQPRLGSEHLRQRGIAMFQMGQYDVALKALCTASDAMIALGESGDRPRILLSGVRQATFIRRDWEMSQAALTGARNVFSEDDLEFVTQLKWTVATGLASDNDRIRDEALQLLNTYSRPAARYGQARTSVYLLGLTPQLNVEGVLRQQWLAHALHASAYARYKNLHEPAEKTVKYECGNVSTVSPIGTAAAPTTCSAG